MTAHRPKHASNEAPDRARDDASDDAHDSTPSDAPSREFDDDATPDKAHDDRTIPDNAHDDAPPDDEHDRATPDEALAPRARHGWRWAAALLISAVILGALVWLADPAALLDALTQASPTHLLGASALFCVTCACRWARVVALVRPEDRRALPLLGVSAGHAFLNKLLPLRTGELTFPVLLRRATGAPLATGLLYLAALRVVELACLAPLYAVAALAFALEVGADTDAVAWALPLACALGLGTLLALPACLRLGLRLLDVALARPALRRFARVQRARVGLASSEAELRRLGLRGVFWLSAATLGVWVSLYGVFHLCVLAFGMEVSLAQTVVASGGGVLSNLLPVNGLGSFGTLEAGWTAGFVATGEAVGPVVASGLVMHLLVVGITGIFAAVGAPSLRKHTSPPPPAS